MQLYMMTVRDRATDVFGQPYASLSVGGAIRGFADEINRKVEGNMLAAHPEDFDLYLLGTYTDATGLFDCGLPKQVAVGKDLVRNKE